MVETNISLSALLAVSFHIHTDFGRSSWVSCTSSHQRLDYYNNGEVVYSM